MAKARTQSPRVHRFAHKLRPEEEQQIRRLFRTRGTHPTATLLGASVYTLEKLAHGQGATAEARDRIQAKLAELGAAQPQAVVS